MIDYSVQIEELEECKGEFDVIGKRLFDLNPEVTESDFPTQEMFALSAQIIYTRKRIADVIADIQDKHEEDGMSEDDSAELMEVLFQDFNRDNDLAWILIEDIAVLKRNQLALSFIARYVDILLSLKGYCQTGDEKLIQKKFKDVALHDMGAE